MHLVRRMLVVRRHEFQAGDRLKLALMISIAVIALTGCVKQSLSAPTSLVPPSYKVPALVDKRAMQWLHYCENGGWPWTEFGPGPTDSPKSPIARAGIEGGFRNLLSPFGSIHSAQIYRVDRVRTNEGHDRTYYSYYVGSDGGKFYYTFAQDADGYVGGVWVKTAAGSFYFLR
jgi:hypothetical protein